MATCSRTAERRSACHAVTGAPPAAPSPRSGPGATDQTFRVAE